MTANHGHVNGHSTANGHPRLNPEPATEHGEAGTPPRKPPGVIHHQSVQEIHEKGLAWLWHGYFPLCKLVLLDGDPGLGKSLLLIDLAAIVSTHGTMPDGSQGIKGDILILSGEDGAADTIRPRLRVAGANLDKVHILDSITD